MAAWNDDKNKSNSVPVPKKHNPGADYIKYSPTQHITIIWNSKPIKKEDK